MQHSESNSFYVQNREKVRVALIKLSCEGWWLYSCKTRFLYLKLLNKMHNPQSFNNRISNGYICPLFTRLPTVKNYIILQSTGNCFLNIFNLTLSAISWKFSSPQINYFLKVVFFGSTKWYGNKTNEFAVEVTSLCNAFCSTKINNFNMFFVLHYFYQKINYDPGARLRHVPI